MRYSTTGANKWDNAQPVTHTRGGGIVALGHNGNLTNTGELRARDGGRVGVDLRASTDSEIIAAMIAAEQGSLLAAACAVMPRLVGAYSVVAIVRAASWSPSATPTACGRWCSAGSTTTAGASPRRPARSTRSGPRYVRDVRPGEAVRLERDGLESRQALPSGGPAPVRVRAHLLRAARTARWTG